MKFGPESVKMVLEYPEYWKKNTIHAMYVEGRGVETEVETREGTLHVKGSFYLATDGVSVWPIAPDFMQENYVVVDK